MSSFPLQLPSFLVLLTVATLLPSIAAGADPIIHNDYGVKLLEDGDLDGGIRQLEIAHGLYASNPTLRGNLATAYALKGRKLLDERGYSRAAEWFEKAIGLFPDDPGYHLLRGMALTLAKDFLPARHELQQARTLGGETAELLYFLGRIHYEEGETEQAVDYWERAATLAPSDPFFGELLERMRREYSVEAGMERGHSSRFIISYDTEGVKTGIALEVLGFLETAYNSVGTDLGHFPRGRIPVILYTRRDYREVTRSPHWSGGLYDGKIRLPVGGLTEMTPELRATLRHELTHAVVHDITGGNSPLWLNEGIAELQGRLEFNPPLVELGKRAKTGDFLPLPELEAQFTSPKESEVHLAYEQSYSIVNFMVSRYGWSLVRGILANLGEAGTAEQAMGRTLAEIGLDPDSFITEWKDYMMREFGGGKRD